jgi:hypothetical protein
VAEPGRSPDRPLGVVPGDLRARREGRKYNPLGGPTSPSRRQSPTRAAAAAAQFEAFGAARNRRLMTDPDLSVLVAPALPSPPPLP